MENIDHNDETGEVKIGIVYICTGKYHIFWKNFYKTAEEFLLRKYKKQYFVFTDSELIISDKNIEVIKKIPEGFPMDSLLRFEMFNGIREKLLIYDYIFFFNSNMNFVREVNNEILPDHMDSGLTGVIHPGHYNKSPFWYPYERNPGSLAMITRRYKRYKYFMGGMFGGKTCAFLELSETCAEWIREDLKNGIIAVYHDESHLNRYFIDKKVLELHPGYGYPEGWTLPFTPRIVILNKVIHGGTFFDKLPKKDYFKRFKRKFKATIQALFWYLK